ncbi:MAG: M56 family metallopeptidase [Terriglobia bacterium]|jgi:beta-lactamase regulating signal transducer with metallopeptidase domain
MIPSSSDLSTKLLYYLAEPAFRALVLAALAGLGLALARAKDAAVRLTVWTAVLYTSRAMPFLARLAPTVPLPIPAFLTARAASPSTQGRMRSAVTGSPVQVVGAAKPFALSSVRPVLGQPQGLPVRPATRNISWQFAAAALDLLVAAILLGRLAVGFYFSRQVTLLSRPISDGRGLQFLLEQSRRWGLRTAPGLAESPAVAVPVTLGWRRPVILLPVAWRGWREEKMRAVLAHELSHVARKDALTRALAAIHRGIFWFSPLAWWLERQLAVLAEQASDDAALSTGADRVLYANVLLGFYQDLRSALGRVRWEGVAMTRGKQAHARVDRILDSTRKLSAGLRKPVWVLVALLAAPVIYVLAGARPVVAQKPQVGIRPVSAMTTAAAASDWQAPPAEPQSPSTPAAPAAPKPAPAAAPAPKPPMPPAPAEGEWRYGDSRDDVMITYGLGKSYGSGTFRDSDMSHIAALRRASSGDIIWFRRNGKTYVIRDAATVQRAQDLYTQERLRQWAQEAFGTKQEAFISEQAELHKLLDQVRVDVPDLTAQLAKLQAKLDLLHRHGATLDELNDLQSVLKGLQGTLRELQGEAGGKMGAIGGEQGALGARMVEVGDQQRELAEKQARSAKENSRKMKALLDDALAKGHALPE